MKLTIDNNDYEFVANAQTPVIFQRVFKKGLLETIKNIGKLPLDEIFDTYSQLAFIMNMQATNTPSEVLKMGEGDWLDWLGAFSSQTWRNMEDDAPCSLIIDYYSGTEKTTVEPKNKVAQ